MSDKRRALAAMLDRLGLARAVLAARAKAIYPWRWLTVVTYHRVSDGLAPGYDPDVVDATPAAFADHVRLLKRYFTLVDTRDLDVWRAGGKLPPNPAMITFDDGYRDNHDVVLPILKREEAKAVFFIATSYVGERRIYWWEHINHAVASSPLTGLTLRYPSPLELPLGERSDKGQGGPGGGQSPERRAAVKALLRLVKQEAGVDIDRFLAELYTACRVPFDRDEERRMADAALMSWDHIRTLAREGMDVQSHSHAHKVLHTLTPAEATGDLRRSREELEQAIDRPVTAVAYPTGRPIRDQPPLRQAVVDAGYRYGFTVERLVPITRIHDWLEIPRMMIDRAVSESFYRSTLAIPSLAY